MATTENHEVRKSNNYLASIPESNIGQLDHTLSVTLLRYGHSLNDYFLEDTIVCCEPKEPILNSYLSLSSPVPKGTVNPQKIRVAGTFQSCTCKKKFESKFGKEGKIFPKFVKNPEFINLKKDRIINKYMSLVERSKKYSKVDKRNDDHSIKATQSDKQESTKGKLVEIEQTYFPSLSDDFLDDISLSSFGSNQSAVTNSFLKDLLNTKVISSKKSKKKISEKLEPLEISSHVKKNINYQKSKGKYSSFIPVSKTNLRTTNYNQRLIPSKTEFLPIHQSVDYIKLNRNEVVPSTSFLAKGLSHEQKQLDNRDHNNPLYKKHPSTYINQQNSHLSITGVKFLKHKLNKK